MARSAAALLTLALLVVLPTGTQAQDPPVTTDDVVHVVQDGETLGSISVRYYGSVGSWQRIFEANRNGLQDPDRIRPGMELRIPGVSAARAEVRGMQVTTGPDTRTAATGDTLTVDDRRELLRGRPFEPAPAPDYDGPRTVFHGAMHRGAEPGSQVLLSPRSEVPTLAPGVFRGAGWLVPEGEALGELGRVRSFVGGRDAGSARTSILPFDDIRVTPVEGANFAVGDRLVLVRDARQVEDLGRILIPTGVIEVRRVDDAGLVARLVDEFAKAELGNLVFPERTFPLEPGVYPGEPAAELEARVLALEDRKEIYLPGDRLFIDVGMEHGVSVGDEFTAYAGSDGGWEGALAGRFQVVGVRDRTATLRITHLEIPQVLRRGLVMSLSGSMP